MNEIQQKLNKKLFDAVKNGNLEQIEKLIVNGAEVDAKDKYGMTPLHWTAMSGNEGVVKALVVNNAEVDAKDNVGWTPLHWAALNNHKKLVEALVAKFGCSKWQ